MPGFGSPEFLGHHPCGAWVHLRYAAHHAGHAVAAVWRHQPTWSNMRAHLGMVGWALHQAARSCSRGAEAVGSTR